MLAAMFSIRKAALIFNEDLMNNPILQVKNLCIGLKKEERTLLVKDVSFDLSEKKTLALVGESGSGKTLTASSLMQIFSSEQIAIKSGNILFEGEDLLQKSENELRAIRGKRIAFIMQNHQMALNPLLTIGFQIKEAIFGKTAKEKTALAEYLLYKTGVAEPKKRLSCYPHELSGGTKQRILIAMAIANNPQILIADEPTTALDVTIQAQILDVLHELKEEFKMSLIFVTHDLGVVRTIADSVAVMHRGKIVEQGLTDEIFLHPKHPYTQSLLQSVLSLEGYDSFEENQYIAS